MPTHWATPGNPQPADVITMQVDTERWTMLTAAMPGENFNAAGTGHKHGLSSVAINVISLSGGL